MHWGNLGGVSRVQQLFHTCHTLGLDRNSCLHRLLLRFSICALQCVDRCEKPPRHLGQWSGHSSSAQLHLVTILLAAFIGKKSLSCSSEQGWQPLLTWCWERSVKQGGVAGGDSLASGFPCPSASHTACTYQGPLQPCVFLSGLAGTHDQYGPSYSPVPSTFVGHVLLEAWSLTWQKAGWALVVLHVISTAEPS